MERKTRDVVECFPYFLAVTFQNVIFHLHVIGAVIHSLFHISCNQITRFHTRFKGHHVQDLWIKCVTFLWKNVC